MEVAAAVALAVASLVAGFALGLLVARRSHAVEFDWRLRISRRDAPGAQDAQDESPPSP